VFQFEAYDALEALADFESSSVSQISRRLIVGALAQAGLIKPPQLKAASQQPAVS
jgi:hypothetical protein